MTDSCKERTVPEIIISKAVGLLVFLFLLYLANIALYATDSPLSYQIVFFLNENVGFLVLMSIIFMFGEVFDALRFPFNLPAPLFNAVGSVFLVFFLQMVFGLLGVLTGVRVFDAMASIAFVLYPFVFTIVLVFGYARIFTCLSGVCKEERARRLHGEKRTWHEVKEDLLAAKNEFVNAIDKALADMRAQKKKENVKGKKKKK